MKRLVEVAHGSGRRVAAHATSKEGMRLAALAGVDTIEHGNDGDEEVFRLMANKGVALCPTLAATEAMAKYAQEEVGRPGRGGAGAAGVAEAGAGRGRGHRQRQRRGRVRARRGGARAG